MSLVDDVIREINSVVTVYFSEIDRNRLGSFIANYLNDLNEDEILEFYRYVIEYYRQKGWRLRAGHFFTPKITKLKQYSTGEIIEDFYHRLYSRRFLQPRLPYDVKIRKYKRLADAVLATESPIYVPSIGLVLEDGLYFCSKVGIGEKERKTILDAYHFVVSLRTDYRDEHPVWRKKPFWKFGVPKELFKTTIGHLYYKEAALLVSIEHGKYPTLENALEEFEKKYSKWIEFLPEPREHIVAYITKFGG